MVSCLQKVVMKKAGQKVLLKDIADDLGVSLSLVSKVLSNRMGTSGVSEKTAEQIDAEVKKIIQRNYDRSDQLLKKHKDVLIKTAELLLQKEVLSSDDITALMNGKPLPKTKKEPAAEKPKEKKAGKTTKKTTQPETESSAE